MTGLLRDVRFALRQLRKSPGFTIAAVLMLALAITANSTVFSWINGTMLHPIPGSHDTSGLVSLMRGQWNISPSPPLSYLDYRDLRHQNHSLVGMLAYHHDWITLTHDGAAPERIYLAMVSSNYFDLLGIKPVVGRFFRPEEETRPDVVPFVVLGYSLWKTHYAGDPAIVGKSIEIARHPVTVIGVAPEGFVGAMPTIREDVWVTLNPIGANNWNMTHRSSEWLNVLGKLRPGVNREQAQQDLDILMRKIVAAYPKDHLGTNTVTLDPMWRSPFGGNVYMARTLPILLAIAGVALLLTCANVATLTLVRFVARRREIAIRQSLGAGRVQLVRQMVLEGVVLSVCAGAVALLLTTWTAKSFALFVPPMANPTVLNGRLDENVVMAIVVLAILASVLCGALPAWRSSQVPAAEALKEESANISGNSHRRLLSGLVVVQIALSLALLVSSALFLRTFRNIAYADPGFQQDHILTVSVGSSLVGYSDEQVLLIRHKMFDRVSVLRGVTVASLTDWLPMSFQRKTADAYPDGYAPHPHESLEVRRADVTPHYFETLGIPIIEGRDFTQDDNEKAPRVLIVDETTARRYWPGQDPLGKKLRIWGDLFTVVGVVKNSKHSLMIEQLEPMIYMNFFQQLDPELIVQLRTRGNPVDLIPAVEGAIREIDGQLPVFDVRTMREDTQPASAFAVITSTFAGMFAVIALVLAITGVYGVVAYRTQLRTHEIGVRVALGASRIDVLRLVLIQGIRLTIIGLVTGLVLAYGLTRIIAGLLYGVSATDPATAIAVVILLGAISLLACYLPAYRATRINPVTAIREL
jgi:predicted permease